MVTDTNYHVTPRLLRMHAEFICEQIDSNTEGQLIRCDECGKLILRILKSDAAIQH
jgi:hypothetical protein